MSHIAKCCQPVAGEVIYGYITKGRGIAVHREDCEQFKRLRADNPARVIEADWTDSYSGGFTLGVRVIGTTDGLLKEVTTLLANAKITVVNYNTNTDKKRHLTIIDLDIEIYNMDDLHSILAKLGQIEGVIEAKRLTQ